VTRPADLAASVRTKLARIARDERTTTEEVIVRYARERLLYRLAESPYRDRFVLKGAALFYLWSDEPHRPTRDIDLLGFGSLEVEEVREIFRDVAGLAVKPDGLSFDVESVEAEEIREDSDYGGVRVKFYAYLGRARARMQVDVGIGDAMTPGPLPARYPTLLPDFPAPELRVYPRETVVAEKLHTIVKLGLINSRMKDYFDLHVLSRQYEFGGFDLCRAIQATFARRETPAPAVLPLGLSPAFAADTTKQMHWRQFVARSQLIPDEQPLGMVVDSLRVFLWPPLEAVAKNLELEKHWSPGGPWT
jgi:predicted nucleotidyltransferase component of viral defense system